LGYDDVINSDGMKLEDVLHVAVDAFRESLDNEAVTAYCAKAIRRKPYN